MILHNNFLSFFFFTFELGIAFLRAEYMLKMENSIKKQLFSTPWTCVIFEILTLIYTPNKIAGTGKFNSVFKAQFHPPNCSSKYSNTISTKEIANKHLSFRQHC